MAYEMLVLDLDGTLTNSKKEITPETKAAIRKVQELGKHVVLASGRPTPGVLPLAKELDFAKYGGYILSFNGGRIINCSTGQIIYNKLIKPEYVKSIYDYGCRFKENLITYSEEEIISAFQPNDETYIEARINKLPVNQVNDFVEYVNFPVNKFLFTGDSGVMEQMEKELKAKFHSALNIFRSEPFFLEVMPQNIDKAHSLQKLLNSLGLTANEMICCGDGYNDLTMIEFAGLGVAMANARPAVLDKADFITKSNDDNGIIHVIDKFIL